jgi:hypothetical protein
MPTTRRRRRQEAREPLEASMRVFLLTGSYRAAEAARPPGSQGFDGIATVMLDWTKHPALWAAHRDELLAEWVRDHPGSRPWGWWRWDAREPRGQLGGQARRINWSEEWWRKEFRGLPGIFVPDPDHPPTFESEAAYLDRLGLLAAEERVRLVRLSDDAFEPEVIDLEMSERPNPDEYEAAMNAADTASEEEDSRNDDPHDPT